MLSFPATKWTTPISSVVKSNEKQPRSRSRGSRFGRTASLIAPRVYLSDYFTALDSEERARLGITHVISVLEHDIDIPDIPEERKLHLQLADSSNVNILAHLDNTTEFITSALGDREDNKVLVHCFQGISRSATVVCAYLVAALGMQASEAIAYTQSKRGIVCPNVGFRKQLEAYSERFAGQRSTGAKSRTAKINADIAGRIRHLNMPFLRS